MAMTKADFGDMLRNRVYLYAETVQSHMDLWQDWQKNVPPNREEGFDKIQWDWQMGQSGQRDTSGDIAVQDANAVMAFSVDFTYGLSGIYLQRKMYEDLINAKDQWLVRDSTFNAVQRQLDTLEGRIKESMEMELFGDGTGRKAQVLAVSNTTKVIELAPVFTPYHGSVSGTPSLFYGRDALKLLREGDIIDVGGISTALTAESCRIVTKDYNSEGTGYKIRCRLATDKPWLVADDLSGVQVGDFIYLHNNRAAMTEAAAVITITPSVDTAGAEGTYREMLGLEAMIGDGYSSDGTTYGQGLATLYGQAASVSRFHKSYVKRGTSMTNKVTWTHNLLHEVEEEWRIRGGLDGAAGDVKGAKEPVSVNGKLVRPVWMIAAPYTMSKLRQYAAQSVSSSLTIFRQIDAKDPKYTGFGGASLVFASRYFGDVPVMEYDRCPEGKIFFLRPNNFFTEHKGPSLVEWLYPYPNSKEIWFPYVFTGGADEKRAIIRTTGQVHTKVRARSAAIVAIDITA